jgi:hypothetical protein
MRSADRALWREWRASGLGEDAVGEPLITDGLDAPGIAARESVGLMLEESKITETQSFLL